MRVVMSTTSVFYTGQRAKLVKRGEGEFALRPNESESNHNSFEYHNHALIYRVTHQNGKTLTLTYRGLHLLGKNLPLT